MTTPPTVRFEDGPLVRGAGRYLGDLDTTGVLHLAVVRSPFAHARIIDVDRDEAEAAPGVELVLTGADLPDLVGPPAFDSNRNVARRPSLISDIVRAVGDPVAVVVASTPAAARDAAELVFVDYEPLPVVGDPEEALSAPPLYPEFPGNVAFDRSRGDRDAVEALGGTAVEGVIEHPRVVPAPLETRGCRAHWEDGKLTVYFGTQAPVLMAASLAEAFDLADDQVRVVVPDMGGAFGCKFDLAEEELLVAEAARRIGKPVQWLETRREHFLAIGHGRAQRHCFKAIVDQDGVLLGLWIDSLVDLGARQRYLAGPPFTPRMGTGTYRVGQYAWRQRGIYTNRTPRGIYRGAGRPEATLTIERIMDRVAATLGLDPAEVRRRNFVDSFPFENPAGLTYDSGDYHVALDALLDMAGYNELRARQRELRSEGRYLGIGLAAYVEATSFEAAEKAIVRVDPTGAVEADVGTQDHGQGHHTTFAQIAGEVLGVAPEKVTLRQGDTALVPFGEGTSGSRSAAHGGSSVLGAAHQVADKVRRIAAHILEADPADIVLRDGRVEVAGAPGSGLSWEEVAAAAHDPEQLPPGEEPGLEEEHHYQSGGLNYPFGMHLTVVEVDVETGAVDLQRVVAVDDCGNIINPMIAAGQRHGGLAQGIGQALFEEAVFDEVGNLVTASFMDYLMPAAGQLPVYQLGQTITPSPLNPLGVKGVAETGAIGITPAIVNAVVDALAPFGVEHIDIPLKPEKVWRAIRG